MIRALLELLFTIAIALVARAVLTSIMKGIERASSNTFAGTVNNQQPRQTQSDPRPTGELHKDPVCGTYVAESAAFRRSAGGQTFYYCSEKCREKHALVAR
jgi:YHS domain-containing protein